MGEHGNSRPPAGHHQPAPENPATGPSGEALASDQAASDRADVPAEYVATSGSAEAEHPADVPASRKDVDPPGAEPAPVPPFLSRGDQVVVALLCVATVVFLLIRQCQVMQWGRSPAALVHADDSASGLVLDVNTASWVEWLQLEGIGETLARRIVAERETGGAFVSVDELTRVRGIGRKTVERLRPWLQVGPEIPPAGFGESGSAGTSDPAFRD